MLDVSRSIRVEERAGERRTAKATGVEPSLSFFRVIAE
jgi:hypothetical protein